MLKFFGKNSGGIIKAAILAVAAMPLAGCLGTSLFDEGMQAYTADEMYPIAARKPCGRDIPNLADDPTNHFAPNHGCAVHANIAAMVADPRVLVVPRKLARPTGTAAVMAISNYEANAAMSTQTSNGAATTIGSTP